MTTADAVAGVLWVGVTAYAVFGGADFGAGFWSLVAGESERGRRRGNSATGRSDPCGKPITCG